MNYEKGPLTTYIQSWFYTARTHCKRRYDFQDDDTPKPQPQPSVDHSGIGNSYYVDGSSSVSIPTNAHDQVSYAMDESSLSSSGENGPDHYDSDGYTRQRLSPTSNSSFNSTDGLDTDIINSEKNYTIRFLAKIADPTGLARKILGIEEVLSIKEKKQLGLHNC